MAILKTPSSITYSINRLIRLRNPFFKNFQRFFPMNEFHADLSFFNVTGQFLIDQGIVKAGIGCIESRSGKEYFLRTGPVNSAHAHGTWLAGGIDFAIG